MKCPHGQLCARLTDRLRRDDPNSFAYLHHIASGEIAAITHGAYPTLELACEYRTDLNPLDTSIFNALDSILINDRIARHKDVAIVRINNILGGYSPKHALTERFDDFTALY